MKYVAICNPVRWDRFTYERGIQVRYSALENQYNSRDSEDFFLLEIENTTHNVNTRNEIQWNNCIYGKHESSATTIILCIIIIIPLNSMATTDSSKSVKKSRVLKRYSRYFIGLSSNNYEAILAKLTFSTLFSRWRHLDVLFLKQN
jgi:hypothetical protein